MKKLIIGILLLAVVATAGLICTYVIMNTDDESEETEVVSQKEKEPEVFSILYTDGTLKFSSSEPEASEDIVQNFGDINLLAENVVPGWRQDQYLAEIKKIEIVDEINPNQVTSYWFSKMENLKEIEGLGKINCDNITSISFSNDASLEEVSLEGMDLSNVESFFNMFSGCSSLKEVNLNNVTTSSKLTIMDSMFSKCTSLKEVDLSGLSDVSGVNGISNAFYGCESLEKATLCKLSSPNFKNASCVFYGCKSLTDVDLSMIDTSSVGVMDAMFSDCTSLTTLDLSNFVLGDSADISCMFQNTPNLKTIYVGSGWDKSKESRGTFTNCGTSYTTVK